MRPAIGIDFGTTNSVVAMVGADGSVRTLHHATGEVFRSVLCFWAGDDGHTCRAAGPAAIEAYLEDPLDSRLIMSMKSYLAQQSFRVVDRITIAQCAGVGDQESLVLFAQFRRGLFPKRAQFLQ